MQVKNRQSKQQQLRNESYMRWTRLEVVQHLTLRTLRANVKLFCVLTLLPLALSLPGCSQLPSRPPELPEPIPKPALTQPLPLVSYSISVQQSLRSWEQMLTGTPLISAPSLRPPEGK